MSLRVARQALLERDDLQGMDFCEAYTAVADDELRSLISSAAGGNLEGLALLAVGGYGRSELCPHSDLDVVLVHRQRRDVAAVADSIWYPVWDEGIRLDYSVRTPADVLAMAGQDLRVQLGLLDARLVAGDHDVADPVISRAREVWRSRASGWLPVLANQVMLRHRKYGDLAFLLEPDLKEAHGGLRDLSGLHAAVLAAPGVQRSVDLGRLDTPLSTLLAVRVELHRRSARAADTLLLQDQDVVASALHFSDADALMLEVSRAGRAIAWASDDLWSRRELWQVTRKRRRWLPGGSSEESSGEQSLRHIESGIAVSQISGGKQEGEALITSDAEPARDITLAFRLAAVAAERGVPVGRASLETLASAMPPAPDPWPLALRGALVRVLASGSGAIRALESLDHFDLLSRLLPEWENVRYRPQRNAYHRFTVDRHLIEASVQAASLTARVARPDLLLIAALLHDIGKGSQGDHTEVGVEIVQSMATRMGFPTEDVATLVTLVQNHLLLSELATRRDLDDPATIKAVVRAVGDRQTLDLLAALTEADSLATGPAAWGPWKAGLVSDLVRRTALVLQGDELPPPAVALLSEENRGLMSLVRQRGPDAMPIVVAGEPRVTVVASDRPGLLASVTGVLSLHGLDLRSADVAGEEGVAVEVFVVEPAFGRWPDWSKVASDLDEVLKGRLELDSLLAKRSAIYERGALVPAEVHIAIDNNASAGSTVVEVRAPDDAALLHRVTSALFDNQLDVIAARACTLGEVVVDAFYVRDRQTAGKVEDPGRLRRIAASLNETLSKSGQVGHTDG